MQQRGGGAIVIIASIFGREAGGRMTYNAVKAAEISLAKSLAQQLAPSNIRVNSVSPGSILFEGGSWWKRQQENPAAMAEFVKREMPLGRFGRPEEVGDVVAFLASPAPAGSAARRWWWTAARAARSRPWPGSGLPASGRLKNTSYFPYLNFFLVIFFPEPADSRGVSKMLLFKAGQRQSIWSSPRTTAPGPWIAGSRYEAPLDTCLKAYGLGEVNAGGPLRQ